MIGSSYWSTGISVAWQHAGDGDYGWAANLEFLDAGFCNDATDTGQV